MDTTFSMESFHLPPEELRELRRITRRVKGSALEWKRARYLILLHEGENSKTVCRCLDIRENLGDHWRKKYDQNGLSFLPLKDYTAREGHLKRTQEQALCKTLRDCLLRDTNEIRKFIRETYGQNYSRSGCIKLLRAKSVNVAITSWRMLSAGWSGKRAHSISIAS